MRLKKFFVAACVTAFAVCLTAAGCAVSATEDELSSLETFQTPASEHENGYLAQYVPDDGFSIDGVLSETVWEENGTEWTFEHDVSMPENPVTMTTMSYLGENGVYFAFSVKDSAIYYSADRKASGNTSVELYIGAFDALEWDGNSFRISVVPTGTDSCITEMRTYRTKKATFQGTETLGKTWALWYQAHFAGCHINGMGIDTSLNEGYDIELFIPYESLGLREKPVAIQYMTAFYHVESAATDADAVWTKCYQNCDVATLGTYLAANNETVLPYAQMADALNTKADSYMTIDGVFDEPVWKTENALTYRFVNSSYGVEAAVSTLAHFGPSGVYLAVTVNDSRIYATNSRNIKYNSGIEIWVQNADDTTVGANSVQLRIDALGNISKWKGTADAAYLEGYFPSLTAVKLLGAQAENGAVATDSAEGFQAELFIPYASLGMDSAPEKIAVYPQYTHAGNLTNVVNSNSMFWYFVQPASQTAAKTDSRNAFLSLRENDFDGTVAITGGGAVFGDGDRLPQGGYGATVTVEKTYAATSAHKVTFDTIPALGVNVLSEGVSATEKAGGEYELTISDGFFDGAGKYDIRFSVGSREETISVYRLDGGFAIDGDFDETKEGWNTANFLTYALGNNSYGVSPDSTVSTLVRLGDAGVYLAVKVADSCIYATDSRNIKYNTGIEIWVQSADNSAVDVGSLQLRVDALGNVERWIGTQENAFAIGSFASVSAVKLLGAQAENGAVATDSAEGFQAEIFIPYSSLGLLQKPEAITVFPQYVHASDLTNTVNSNGSAWSYYNPASQSTAKTDSKNAFLYFYDNDYCSTLAFSASSILFGAEALSGSGAYTQTLSATRSYAVTASHTKKFLSVPVRGAAFEASDGGVTFDEQTEEGVYMLTLAPSFTETLRGGVKETVTVTLPSLNGGNGAQTVLSFAMPSAAFDGAVTESDGYSVPYYFYAKETHEMEAAVYVKTYDYGVSVALVLESPYINYGGNTTGNNGGGFEIRMANSVSAETGLWWRVFADGTARTNTNLTQGAPSTDRTKTPVGSSAFAVGLVANDGSDLSLGYKRMTVEYFVEYSAIGATGAEDFYLAVGVNDTNASNGTMSVHWLDGVRQSNATVLQAEYWVTADGAENYNLNIANATAIFGKGTFTVATTLSPYTYPKGVSFSGEGLDGENITQERGTFKLSGLVGGGTTTVTAELNASRRTTFTVTNYLPSTAFDGAVTESDGYSVPYYFYAKETHEMEAAVYVKTYDYGVSVALVLESPYINYGTNTTGNNGGGFEIRMANSVSAETGLWWRVFADGTARTNTNLTQGAPSTDRTKTPVGSSAFAVGLVANDGSDLSLGYKRMTVEYFVEYSAIGATGAEDFYLAVGVNDTNATNGTMSVHWLDGVRQSNATVLQAEYWVTADGAENFGMSISEVVAENGAASFRIATTISAYTYLKGVSFAGAEVTAGEFGMYRITVTGASTTVTATLGETLSKVFTVKNSTHTLDGVISGGEYTGYITLSTAGLESDNSVDMKVYYFVGADSVYLAYDVTPQGYTATVKNTGAEGGQGSARITMAVASADHSHYSFYRAYASGCARTRTNWGYYVTSAGVFHSSLDYMAGSHTVAAGGETVTGITNFVLEWQFRYADWGVSSADDMIFLLGCTNSGDAKDYLYQNTGANGVYSGTWATASNEFVKTDSNYFTIGDIIALSAQQGAAQ